MNDKCKDISIYLSGYQDRELDEKRHRWVSEHLAYCSQCSASLAELERLTTGLHRLEEKKADDDFTARVMGQILQNAPAPLPGGARRFFRSGWYSSPAFVYSLVFVVFCLLGILINPVLRPAAGVSAPAAAYISANTLSPDITDGTNVTDVTELTAYSNVLTESQQLNLMDVHEQSLDLLAFNSTNRTSNEGGYER